MSSYLNIYIKPKKTDSEPILFKSYTRSSNIYQYFYENMHPTFIGMEETQYTEITYDKISDVYNELSWDIKKLKRRIEEYEKNAAGNSEIIEEVINLKEYLEELEDTMHIIEFFKDTVLDTKNSWIDYILLCNVD